MLKLELKLLKAYARINLIKVIMLIMSITIGISSVLLLVESTFTAEISKIPREVLVTMDASGNIREMVNRLNETDIVKDIELLSEVQDTYFYLPNTFFQDRVPELYCMGAIHNDKEGAELIMFGKDIENNGEILYSEAMLMADYGVDDKINIEGKEMHVVGQGAILSEAYFIVTESDFYELCELIHADAIKIKLYYSPYVKEAKLDEIVDMCNSYSGIKDIEISQSKAKFMFMEFINAIKDYLIITIISIINSMFIYYSFIKDRVRDYSIFKISGLSDWSITKQFFYEILILYNGAFVLSLILTVIYKQFRNNGYYNFLKVCGFSYFSVLICLMVIYFVILFRITKKTPIALYRESRILK